MKGPVGFFVISTELGGAEKSLLDFLKIYQEKNSNFVVFTPKDSGPLIDALNKNNISSYTLKLPQFFLSLSRKKLIKSFFLLIPSGIYSLIYLHKMHNQIKAHELKTLHSTGLKFHILLCLLSLFNSKCVFHIHVRDIINLSILKLFFSFFSKRKNVHFIFNSKASAQALPQHTPLVIYNGFDHKLFSPGNSSLKKQLQISENTTLIGLVGVIARWKGQREFLHLAQALLQQKKNLHFLIVGDEIYDTFAEKGELSHLKTLAQKLNLNNKDISFMGFQKNIEPIYQGLDLLIHCSISPEPFGRVIVEAMLCGCPVIASDQGGPLEIITHKQNGILYKQADASSLLDSTKLFLEDDDLKQSLIINGRKRGKDFSLQAYTDALSAQLRGR